MFVALVVEFNDDAFSGVFVVLAAMELVDDGTGVVLLITVSATEDVLRKVDVDGAVDDADVL